MKKHKMKKRIKALEKETQRQVTYLDAMASDHEKRLRNIGEIVRRIKEEALHEPIPF